MSARTAAAHAHIPPLHAAGLLAGVAALAALAAYAPAAALATAGTGALVAAALAWPELATLLVVFCVWLNVPALAVDRFEVPEAIGAVFPFVLLAPIADSWRRGRRLVVGRPFWPLAVLLLVALISTVVSAHPDVAVEHLRQFALEGLVAYLLVINAVRTPETLRRVLWALLAAGACLALVSLYQQISGTFDRPYGGLGQVDSAYFRGQSAEARLAGPLGDPNYYAQILLPIVPLGLIAISGERSRTARVAAAGAVLLVCLAMTFTYSRGAVVAFVAVLLAMACLRRLRARHVVVIALGVTLLLVSAPAFRDRVESIADIGGATARSGEQTSADESTRGRTTEMLAAKLAFFDHPLLGVGPGVFPYYYQQYAQQVGIEVHEETRSGPETGNLPRREAHNIWLGLAADLGLAGLAAFGAIMFVSFRELARVRRRWLGIRPEVVGYADALLLALVAYFAAGLFLTLAFERYLWLLIALAGAAGTLYYGRLFARE